MELFLHIGTNKTASSYLQTLQTKNKKLLQKEKIYCPPSEYDKEMLSGKISPGNGHVLANILCLPEKRDEQLHTYFKNLIRSANREKCSKICLSNEILIRLFSNEELIQSLSNAATKAGFIKINMFCFLRNPYEHALSLYKHRMKSGNVIDYSKWLETDYKTISLFRQFLQHFTKSKDINWSFRVYKRDPAYMMKVYFYDFLGITTTIDHRLPKSVNPSMSLKGIKIMGVMEKIRSGAGAFFYRYSTENNIKISEEGNLEQKFFAAYNDYLNTKFPNITEQISSLLPSNEQSEFLRLPSARAISYDVTFSLNESEFEAVCQTFSKMRNKNFLTSGIVYLKRLKAKYLNKPQHFDSSRYGGSLRN
ncbi:MAG TPA: hypothetical protein VFM72_06705 [Aequorivita sp.]|nr:hypothetical protein [Aequorivita sp.]